MTTADVKSLPEAVRRRRHHLEKMNKTVLQKRYYNAHQLRLVKRINLYYELFLAVGTSSAVGAWAVLRYPIVNNFWAIFLGLITVLAVLKPILQLSGQIQRYSEAYIGYSDLSFDLKDLLAQIDLNRKVGAQIDKSFDRGQEKLRELARLDDPRPRRRVFERCGFEASREINDASYNPSPAQAESPEVRTETINDAGHKPSPAQAESPEVRTETINDAGHKPSPAQAGSPEVRTETINDAGHKPSPAQAESPEMRTETTNDASYIPSPAQAESPEMRTEPARSDE